MDAQTMVNREIIKQAIKDAVKAGNPFTDLHLAEMRQEAMREMSEATAAQLYGRKS